MAAALRRFFDVRPGEARLVVLTLSYVALAVASFLLAKPIRNGLFLSQYGAYKLVYVYVAVPVALSLAIPLYARVAARVGTRLVVTGSLIFFSLNVLAFWYLFRFAQVPGLPAIFYVWVNCFGIIAPVQAWSFANTTFDTRQARRLFGLIGSGASLGAILGGLLAREFARRLGTINLLLVLAALILLAAVVVNVAWLVRRQTRMEAPGRMQPVTLREAIGLVRGSSYLSLIAAMVFIVAIATQWTQFQFSLAAELRYVGDSDRLTRFFGNFNFWLGVVAFAIQLFATGPALRRFGVGATILLLPLALILGSILTVALPLLLSVMLTNAFDQALRFSVDKSTFELLYLPLPARVKAGAKAVIDLIVNRVGDGVGGVMLGVATQGFSLWFANIPGAGFGLRGLAAITAVLSFAWLAVAIALRRGYVQAITDSIHQYRLDVERASAPVLDRSAASALVSTLEAADPEAVLYALRAFELEQRRVPHPAVRGLLNHPSAKVRARALALLNAAGDRSVLGQVEPMLGDTDLHVRTQALLYLSYHARIDPLERIQSLGDFPGYSIRAGMVAFLSQPGRLQNIDAARVLLDGMVHESGESGKPARLEAATLLAHLPNEFGSQLGSLVQDEDRDVVRAALGSLAELGRRDLAELVVTRLSDPALAEAARDALVALGAGVLPVLGAALGRSEVPIERRRAIPAIVAQIGTAAGQRLLIDNLLQHDVVLRMRVIGALNTFHKLHQDIDVDRQAVEMVLMAEIMGHYRSYQILGSLGDALEETEPVALALHASMQQEVERIFRLMALRWPEFDMHSAYVGLTSRNATVRANALEFLDNILKPQVRSLVVPLLDAQVPTEERVRLADHVLGTSVDTHQQAVAALLASDDPWLRACGVYAVGLLRIQALEPELDRLADTGDALLAQTVQAAKARLAGEAIIEPRGQRSEPSAAWPAQEGMGVG